MGTTYTNANNNPNGAMNAGPIPGPPRLRPGSGSIAVRCFVKTRLPCRRHERPLIDLKALLFAVLDHALFPLLENPGERSFARGVERRREVSVDRACPLEERRELPAAGDAVRGVGEHRTDLLVTEVLVGLVLVVRAVQHGFVRHEGARGDAGREAATVREELE